ncbi:MAG: APC family permease [Roseiflexus sp.]|jgi:amino acid transporter|uniref:APC family permease n=1 Tax=Roseiflexus sp. TaxID=2562120 RepID=UPI0025E7F737|nr:APC family permease [Roseiflexus sp.]MCL6541954.1 APC family permease [Roseiflexus sp.]
MIAELKRLVVGQPLANEQLVHERLPKRLALAVFSSDALSSTAYATEAILIVLSMAGAAALWLATPIALGIAVLLMTVAFSYMQTIKAYPQGGGTYIVARENLGTIPSLTAASALLIDYILTVAVSMSAGVAAITSAWPMLEPYRVELAVGLIGLVSLANLRGVKESGAMFAIPTYTFVASMFLLIGTGLFNIVTGHVIPAPPPATPHLADGVGALSLFLILRAFAAGCTALTGIEAIADGVPAFKKPEARNAAITLAIMAALLVTMFLGITVLANAYHIIPDGSSEPETANSQLARAIFGAGSPFYFLLQIATMAILVLASNTAFADFPRLAYFLARDRYFPRQFTQRGDRLVFSNGIVVLGLIASILVVAFHAREQALLPLYAVGVFISFTISQTGMVRRWWRLRTPGWRRSALINGAGAVMTGIVMLVLAITKFREGAWAVLLLIPLMVTVLLNIHQHYQAVARQLSLADAPRPSPVRRHTALVLISGVHRGMLPALQYALSIAPDNVTAVYVDLDPENTEKIRRKWNEWGCGIPLVILPSPYRSLMQPLLQYIDEVEARYDDDVLTIILPEFVPSKWWQYILHNQTGLQLKAALFFSRGKVVTSVPYHLEH